MIPPNPSDTALRLLAEGAGAVWLPVSGESMRPTLLDGDRVCIEPFSRPPRFGDLLLFRQADYLAIHRCLGPARGAGPGGPFRARGDGRLRLDPPVAREAVLGRAIAVDGRRGMRSLEGTGARGYARAVAFHALAWAWAGAVARRFGAAPERFVARVDAVLLAASDAVFFRLLHRAPPEGAPERA